MIKPTKIKLELFEWKDSETKKRNENGGEVKSITFVICIRFQSILMEKQRIQQQQQINKLLMKEYTLFNLKVKVISCSIPQHPISPYFIHLHANHKQSQIKPLIFENQILTRSVGLALDFKDSELTGLSYVGLTISSENNTGRFSINLPLLDFNDGKLKSYECFNELNVESSYLQVFLSFIPTKIFEGDIQQEELSPKQQLHSQEGTFEKLTDDDLQDHSIIAIDCSDSHEEFNILISPQTQLHAYCNEKDFDQLLGESLQNEEELEQFHNGLNSKELVLVTLNRILNEQNTILQAENMALRNQLRKSEDGLREREQTIGRLERMAHEAQLKFACLCSQRSAEVDRIKDYCKSIQEHLKKEESDFQENQHPVNEPGCEEPNQNDSSLNSTNHHSTHISKIKPWLTVPKHHLFSEDIKTTFKSIPRQMNLQVIIPQNHFSKLKKSAKKLPQNYSERENISERIKMDCK